ncbi:MAG: hypothetical protein MUC62_01660 [Candidatus Thermoplasmatota archaeon]|nr:hypothetical protein [Candidatus Thermoplasmatota archaeon]
MPRSIHIRTLVPVVLAVLVACLMVDTPPVRGDAKDITVPAGGSRSVALGFMYTGSSVQYSWITGSELELTDFYIEDTAGRKYQELTETFQGGNTFSVTLDGSYLLTWDCKKYPYGVQVSYSFKVTAVTITSDLTVDISIDNNMCPQGQSTDFDIKITNPNSGQIKLGMVGLHLDWMEAGQYLKNRTVDLQVTTVQSKEQLTVTIKVDVADDANLGLHFYEVNVTYDLLANSNWHTFYWNSGNLSNFYVVPMDSDGDSTPDVEDAFPNDPNEQKDTDGDKVGDKADAFLNDPAASKDADKDGHPDVWNLGYSESNSTTGLRSDAFPQDPAASNDTDGDGYPNEWNVGKTQLDSTTGLVLDRYPDDPYKWKEVKVSHTKTYIILATVVVGLIMLMFIAALVVVRVKKSMESAKKEADKEAERVRKEMEEHKKAKEFERSGGRGEGSDSNVSILGGEGETVVSAVPTTLAEAHALDGQTKKPVTYEDLYGKKEEPARDGDENEITEIDETTKEE